MSFLVKMESKNFYYFSICNVCKKQSVNLKKCCKCKIAFYCSREHQRQDWLSHKTFCKAVNQASRFLTLPPNPNLDDFNKFKFSHRALWIQTLNRDLTVAEEHMWKFPKVCVVCFSDNVTIICEDCDSVGYCSKEHQDIYRDKHNGFCEQLKIGLQVCQRLYNGGSQSKWDLFHIKTEHKELPGDMKEVLKMLKFETEVVFMPKTVDLNTLAHFLSPVVNIVQALEKSGFITRRQAKKPNLVIHMVGDYPVDFRFYFNFIRHWIVNLEHLDLHHIDKERLMIDGFKLVDHCISCKLEKCVGKYIHHCADYDFKLNLPKPDLVVILQPDVHTCGLILPFFLVKKVPIMFLSHRLKLLKDGVQGLSQGRFNILAEPQKNFYRSLKPERNYFLGEDPVNYPFHYFAILSKN